jgi:hypothetical protein
MDKRKLLSRLSLVGGSLVMIIGILHGIATPMIYRGAAKVLPDKALGLAYFFGVMGLYVIFAGWLMIYSSRGLARGERWAWTLALANGVCNTVAGVGAAAVGFRHSLVWIWLAAALLNAVLAAALSGSYLREA